MGQINYESPFSSSQTVSLPEGSSCCFETGELSKKWSVFHSQLLDDQMVLGAQLI